MRLRNIFLCLSLLFLSLLFVKQEGYANELDMPKEEVESEEEIKEQEEDFSPQFYVYYHEYRRLNQATCPEFVEEKIHSIAEEDVDSQSELYLDPLNKITLEMKALHFQGQEARLVIEAKNTWEDPWKDVTQDYVGENSWEEQDNHCYYLSFQLKKEGHYRLRLTYADDKGRPLISGNGEKQWKCFQDGQYEGPILTVDQTNPELLSFSSDTECFMAKGNYPLYQEFPSYEIRVAEENFNAGYFRWLKNQKGISMSSWESEYVDGIRVNKAFVHVNQEGVYQLLWNIAEASGRNSCQGQASFTVDQSQPEIRMVPVADQKLFQYSYEEVTYFSGKPIHFQISGFDPQSGIRSIRYTYYDQEGEKKEEVVENPDFTTSFSKEISFNLDYFKGWITAEVTNGLGISSKLEKSPTILWEKESIHKNGSDISLSFSQPVYKDDHTKVSYYKEWPEILMKARDDDSGISTAYMEMAEDGEKQRQEETYSQRTKISWEINRKWQISPGRGKEENGQHKLSFSAGFVDNAGNESSWKETAYRMVVDNVNPQISIEYDQIKDQPYYNCVRTAVVTVEDWNFNEKAVQWTIKGKKKGYSIGPWNGSGKKHWCKVTFLEDGTYQMGLWVRDYSGNLAGVQEKQEFVIDCQKPEVCLWMNISDLKNQKYYAHKKRLYVLVKDQNVGKEEIHLYKQSLALHLTPLKKEEIPKDLRKDFYDKSWQVYGYECDQDGLYAIRCYCQDKAGNRSLEKKLATFVIDASPPSLEVKHLRKNMSYEGHFDAEITITDEHLSLKNCQAEICYADGKKMTSMDGKLIRMEEKNRVVFRWDDFSERKENDNRYVLKISAVDLAGNGKNQVETIPFYMNRYGTRYIIEEGSMQYLNRYYHNKEEELVVKAYSLLPILEEIHLYKNHEQMMTLHMNQGDYTKETRRLTTQDSIEEKILPKQYTGWYETCFRINKELFEEEGDYSLSICDREKCLGEQGAYIKNSENVLWTKEIQFAIDKTPPCVTLGGIDQEIYVSNSLKYIITATDNHRLKRVRIQVRKNGKTIVKNYGEEDFNELHSITEKLTADHGYQYVSFEAWDYAGNYMNSGQISADKRVLISENKLVRLIHNQSLTLIGGVGAMILGIFLLFILTGGAFFGILRKE